MNIFVSERDNAAACHHDLIATNFCVFNTREERIDTATDTLVKVRKKYDEGRKVTVEAHVAE